MAAAETTQFRLGHLIAMVFDILGFNITDLTLATPDYIFLMLLMAFAGIFLFMLKWKTRKQ